MKKTLRKPENWQDFESLCKKLWGEIWQTENIKKNGRLGQEQSGVDIVAFVRNEYRGIQCKGKDDYTNAKLTEKEISEELTKAESFQPPLKRFIFATSANKDAKIEAYVRNLNIQSVNKGLFEIELYCWEDIVDFIDEYQHTRDWYLDLTAHKQTSSVSVTFANGRHFTILEPEFFAEPLDPSLKPKPKEEDSWARLTNITSMSSKINKSKVPFQIKIANNGSKVIENYKLSIEILRGEATLDYSNHEGGIYLPPILFEIDVNIQESKRQIHFIPKKNTSIVQKDHRMLEGFIRIPHDEKGVVRLKWHLLSRDFSASGRLGIMAKPQIFVYENDKDTLTVSRVFSDHIVNDH